MGAYLANRVTDLPGDLVLNGENIRRITLEFLRPSLPAVACVDQLDTCAHVVARPPNAAFQQLGNVQGGTDFPGVAAAVGTISLRAETRDDFQIGDTDEVVDDPVLHPGGKRGVVRIRAQVFERENRDGFVTRRNNSG